MPSNKHTRNDISLKYMQEVLGPWERCPKRKCSGTLTEVWISYAWADRPIKEKECTTCGKVVKDFTRRIKHKPSSPHQKKYWHSSPNRAYNKLKGKQEKRKSKHNASSRSR